MSGTLDDKFIKRSNENSALFHFFPGAIFEFRDRVWRVNEMHGKTPREIISRSNAFQDLLGELEEKGIHVDYFSGLIQGTSEIFPMSWYCSNPSCNRFVMRHLKDRRCNKCGIGEMRQIPIVVICDNCGYLDAVSSNRCSRNRNHDSSQLRLMMYEREKIGTWRIVCQSCLEESSRNSGFALDDPDRIREYSEEFRITSDLDPGSPCPGCSARRNTRETPGKRVVPAGANVVAPAFTTAFDKDMLSIINTSKSRLTQQISYNDDLKEIFAIIQKDFSIKEIHLTDIIALNCTYGYKVGNCSRVKSFQNGTIFLKSDQCEALIIEFDSEKIDEINKVGILHSIAHSLLQVVGYISGLDNEVYREFIDPKTCTVMIFTTEAGGCSLFINEPSKLMSWLKRARNIIHECKNQCSMGCPWCLHLRTWQCNQFNHNLNRIGLSNLWEKRVEL